MEYHKFIVSNQKEESINIQRVRSNNFVYLELWYQCFSSYISGLKFNMSSFVLLNPCYALVPSINGQDRSLKEIQSHVVVALF